jgi:hypothetical protein
LYMPATHGVQLDVVPPPELNAPAGQYPHVPEHVRQLAVDAPPVLNVPAGHVEVH